MPTVLELLRASVEGKAFPPETPRLPPLEELRRTEWSDEFEQLMRNRLLMGAFRYQLMAEKKRMAGEYRIMDSIRRRLDLYEASGSLEPLVDIANLCLIEFEMQRTVGKKLNPIDDGEHVERV